MIAAAVRALAGWKGYVAAAVVAGVLAGGAAWKVQGWRYGAEIAGMERDQAQQLADATQLARQTEQARWAKREGIINDAKTQTAAALADSDRARAAAERLRAQLARLRAPARDPAAAGRSQGLEGSDPIGLLADMYERGAADAIERSGYADALRRAGLTCEKLYDSVQKESRP